MLAFGEGIGAKVNVALWHTRGEHSPMIGKCAFEISFKHRKELPPDTMNRLQAFFATATLRRHTSDGDPSRHTR